MVRAFLVKWIERQPKFRFVHDPDMIHDPGDQFRTARMQDRISVCALIMSDIKKEFLSEKCNGS